MDTKTNEELQKENQELKAQLAKEKNAEATRERIKKLYGYP